jgi:hypothetical protein
VQKKKNCEVNLVAMALKDILQISRIRVADLFNLLVEFVHVTSHPDETIFLWGKETWHTPFGIIDMKAEAEGAFMIHSLLVDRNVASGRNTIRLHVQWQSLAPGLSLVWNLHWCNNQYDQRSIPCYHCIVISSG